MEPLDGAVGGDVVGAGGWLGLRHVAAKQGEDATGTEAVAGVGDDGASLTLRRGEALVDAGELGLVGRAESAARVGDTVVVWGEQVVHEGAGGLPGDLDGGA